MLARDVLSNKVHGNYIFDNEQNLAFSMDYKITHCMFIAVIFCKANTCYTYLPSI